MLKRLGLLLFTALALVAAPATADTAATAVEIGRQYRGGDRVLLPEAGLTFTIPAGWVGGMPFGEPSFIIVSDEKPGLILVFGLRGSAEEAAAALARPLRIDQNVALEPDGEVRRDGDTLRADYAVPGLAGPHRGHAAVRLGPHGVAALALAIGPADEAEAYRGIAEAIVAGVGFDVPPAPAAPAK